MAVRDQDPSSEFDALYGPLGPDATVFDRFPEVPDGIIMLEHINKVYRRRNKVTIDFYNKETGEWQLLSHPENNREQDQTVEDYVDSICRHGYMHGARGLAWTQYSKGGAPPYLMITFAPCCAINFRLNGCRLA